ncbi:hypothetical protein LTR40_010216, partial [Exophiala xenobiotica]
SESVLKRIEDALPRTPIANTPIMPSPIQHDPMDTRLYMNDDMLGEPLPEDAFVMQGGQGSIEELFPEIFADFTDTALFPGPVLNELR